MITIIIFIITVLVSNSVYGNNIIDIKREREIEELERLKKRKNKESKEESIKNTQPIVDFIIFIFKSKVYKINIYILCLLEKN